MSSDHQSSGSGSGSGSGSSHGSMSGSGSGSGSDSFDGWHALNDQSSKVDFGLGSDGHYIVPLSQEALYGILALIIGLLILNLICLAYSNCATYKRSKHKYSKVSMIASSEDEMGHLNPI
eukprot:1115520_1